MTREQFEDLRWSCGYTYLGIRSQDPEFEMGETIYHQSMVWLDGEETEDELPGLCALHVRSEEDFDRLLEVSKNYYGFAHIAILGSNSVEYGEDENEIIMDEPEVLAIIR